MRYACADLKSRKRPINEENVLWTVSVEGRRGYISRSDLLNNALTAFRHLHTRERRRVINKYLSQNGLLKWEKTSIGLLGYPLADELEPLIRKWVEKHISPEVWPGDLANIAREVVEEICVEHRAHGKFTNHSLAMLRKGRNRS